MDGLLKKGRCGSFFKKDQNRTSVCCIMKIRYLSFNPVSPDLDNGFSGGFQYTIVFLCIEPNHHLCSW